MAEIKTGIFAKNVQKRLSRAQEKVLQKLGKADETKDDHFDQAVQNFKRQETEGSRLQREMKAYLAAVKAMQQASINLTESLHEVYEPDWHGKDDVLSIGKNCDALWEDFHQKLVDSSLSTLDTYLQQFPDLKIRVAKRSRKLIDYDSARHHLETIQAVANRSDRKVTKAEEELKKAQKVFDELNVGLQDELPTLWDSRVGFYVNTFKNVTSLEAKFHREISVLCRQLYEVMTKLGEQHSDKMFTIQGAPSDSGPLRLSRAPSPPDSDSDESPGTTPNHMLAPISPGPPRPKSPSGQLKKGPPVPPPPKTPTKELHQEQIIDLFGGQFLPAASPSQPNERPGESLLDLDFDPFKPDTNAPIGQAVSPLTQQLPWDLWTGSVEPVQPAEDSGFAPNWAADFSAAPENGDTVPPATEGAAEELPTATGKEEAQSWPSEDGWGGEAAGQPQGAESATAGDEVSGWDPDPQLTPDCDPCAVGGDREARQEPPAAESWGWDVGMGGEGGSGDAESGGWEGGMGGEGGSGVIEPGDRLEPASRGGQADSEAAEAGWRDRRKSTPGLRITNEHGQVIVDTPEGSEPSLYLAHSDGREGFGSGSEYETAEEGGDAAGQNGGWASADEDLDTVAEQALPDTSTALGGSVVWEAGDAAPLVPELKAPANDTGFVAHWDQPAEQAPLQSKENVEAIADPIGVQELGCTGVEVLDFGADPFAEISGGGGFVTDPFAETPGGFASDPFGGGAFESDPFAETQGGGADVGFVTDPFAETTGESVAGWAADPFANSDSAQWADFPTPSTETGRTDDSGSWQEVSDSSGFFSSGSDVSQAGNLFASFPGPGREAVDQGGVVRRAHKEPENSDLSEDEVANRRYGKLYQEIDTEKEEVTSNAFNGFPQMEATAPTFVADFDKLNESEAIEAPEAPVLPAAIAGTSEAPGAETQVVPEAGEIQETAPTTGEAEVAEIQVTAPPTGEAEVAEIQVTAPPAGEAEVAELQETTSPTGETVVAENLEAAPPTGEAEEAESATSPNVEKPASTEASPVSEEAAPTEISPGEEAEKASPSKTVTLESVPTLEEVNESPLEETLEPVEAKGSPQEETPTVVAEQVDENFKEATGANEGTAEAKPNEEKMPIPSVVIEPASSNEGDDDRDIVDIISPTAISDNGVISDSQAAKNINTSDGPPGLPPGYLYKVETLHDFEAANSDELDLKRGDIVLVVPTATVEDQDAGWLTGIKESDWLHLGACAHQGLFPENFTQRLE